MLDGFNILTLTHRDAALDYIANAVVPDGSADALLALKNRFGWSELMYLATCNRVTYVFYTQQPLPEKIAVEVLRQLRPDLTPVALQNTAASMRLLRGAEAVQHLFEVAASMDSLVVGEREILRQLRQAYDRCYEWGLTGDHLRLLMRHTIEVAKEVYTETGIGEKALSVVALAFNAMMQQGLPTDARILMVGAGETNTLFTKFLIKYGFKNVTIFNRTLENARQLADSLGGRAFPLDALATYREGFDALIVCTGATHAVISPELYAALLQGDSTRKIVVDLSVPHNVAPGVHDHFPVNYIEIGQLRDQARENLSHREQACVAAAELIEARIPMFRERWHERQVERALAHIPDEVRSVKEKAVNEVFAKDFAALDPAARELVMNMLGYMEKKCVAIPIKAAKSIALHAKRQAEHHHA
jgi:glutamyl-tRNA reductase